MIQRDNYKSHNPFNEAYAKSLHPVSLSVITRLFKVAGLLLYI